MYVGMYVCKSMFKYVHIYLLVHSYPPTYLPAYLPTYLQVLSENVGAWFEPYASHLLRRVLSSLKGARVQVTAAEQVGR